MYTGAGVEVDDLYAAPKLGVRFGKLAVESQLLEALQRHICHRRQARARNLGRRRAPGTWPLRWERLPRSSRSLQFPSSAPLAAIEAPFECGMARPPITISRRFKPARSMRPSNRHLARRDLPRLLRAREGIVQRRHRSDLRGSRLSHFHRRDRARAVRRALCRTHLPPGNTLSMT